ncbi:uncharacterized protein PSFLO_01542 [Pseudozyma flocculosa]|uniref:Uncharacterized protein n=1 Tax=Pseudozyma flocculosa TaxID=84751 RepID=A0A5C3EYE4_9BASI|nr:uncharacterized protein PSFLO_01542 [Pseudozyma flocculosa]
MHRSRRHGISRSRLGSDSKTYIPILAYATPDPASSRSGTTPCAAFSTLRGLCRAPSTAVWSGDPPPPGVSYHSTSFEYPSLRPAAQGVQRTKGRHYGAEEAMVQRQRAGAQRLAPSHNRSGGGSSSSGGGKPCGRVTGP